MCRWEYYKEPHCNAGDSVMKHLHRNQLQKVIVKLISVFEASTLCADEGEEEENPMKEIDSQVNGNCYQLEDVNIRQ